MDQLTILIVAIVCLLIGFLTGDLIRSILAHKNDAEPEGPPETISKKKAPNRHWVEVLTLWRDRRNDNLTLDIGGKTFQRETDLVAPVRDQLLQIVTEFYDWLKPESAASSSGKEIATSTDSPTDIVLPKSPKPRSKFNPLDAFANAIRTDVPKSASLPESIVAQVDAILQEQLKASPLEEKAIRLMELPGKGMVVIVGLDRYEEVDNVPDESIRALIHSAVAEWERRGAGSGEHEE